MADPVPPRRLTGACLCGQLRYEVDDAFRYAMYCHCSRCRKTTGSAFKPLAGIEARRLTLHGPEAARLIVGQPSWHNVNCRCCGSFLYAVVREGTFIHLAMGSLADDPTIRPSMHIFVGSKAPWFTITDDLPRHEGFPPAE